MKKSKLCFLTCLAVCVLCMSAFSVTAFAGGSLEYEKSVTEPIETAEEPDSGEPLSEETVIVTRDLLYDKATNKQFITIEDRDGNIFYLVIDYDAPVNEDEEQFKTYFLNPVDTDDLAALAKEEEPKLVICTCREKCVAGAVDTNCPVCATNMTECAGKETKPAEPEPEPTTESEPEKNNSAAGVLVLLMIVVLGGGGAFAYIKFIKSKPQTKTSPDLDDYDFEDENDEEDAEMPEYALDEEDDEDGAGSEDK